MNFNEVVKFINEKSGEHLILACNTENKAKDLLTKLHREGYKWESNNSLTESSNWEVYGEETCYMISPANCYPATSPTITFCNKSFYLSGGYKVINYEIIGEEERWMWGDCKYKDAISAIKSNYPPENYSILREALDLAMETLKKEIPIQSYICPFSEFTVLEYCSICKNMVSEGDNYCNNCGQKIDWS